MPLNHYRAYAHEHGPSGWTVAGSASVNGNHADAVRMATDLGERCPMARVEVFQSGSARPIISNPPKAGEVSS